MNSNHMPLRLEPVEDRTLPATLITWISDGWMPATVVTHHGNSDHAPRGNSASHRSDIQVFRDIHGTTIIRIPTWSGGWNTGTRLIIISPRTGDTPPPAKEKVEFVNSPTAPSESAQRSVGNSPQSSGRSRAVTQGPTKPDTPDVAVSIPTPNSTSAVNNFNTAGPAADRNVEPAPNVPPVVFAARMAAERPALMAYTMLIDVDEVVNPTAAPPSESAEPMLAPTPAEPAPPAPLPPAEPPSALPALTNILTPIAGLLPLDQSAVESGVTSVLSGIADLGTAWADDSSGYEDYLWVGAAVLVAGGVTQAARVHRARSTDRRTLGFDSVLARWGKQDVVQPY
jgi:hypothetical protein